MCNFLTKPSIGQEAADTINSGLCKLIKDGFILLPPPMAAASWAFPASAITGTSMGSIVPGALSLLCCMSIPVKAGIPEFLNGVGKGVETHIPKLEAELGDLQKLLVTRTLKLKKLGIPCKHRKLILKFTHKYRLGVWRPRADSPK